MTAEEHELILRLNKEGLPISEIAIKLKRSYYNVWHYFKKEKIPSCFIPGKRLSLEETQKVLYSYEISKSSITTIAARFGTNKDNILRILEEHDIEIRPSKKIAKNTRKVKYNNVNGEKVCEGLSYLDYLKKEYGKDYRKKLKNYA